MIYLTKSSWKQFGLCPASLQLLLLQIDVFFYLLLCIDVQVFLQTGISRLVTHNTSICGFVDTIRSQCCITNMAPAVVEIPTARILSSTACYPSSCLPSSIPQISVTVTNTTTDDQHIKKQGLFVLRTLEVSGRDWLALLLWACDRACGESTHQELKKE